MQELEKPQSLSIDELVTGDMPEVKQNAIDAVTAQKQGDIDKASRDEGFDPSIHVVDGDGKPKRNKNGTLKKKRGRKKGATNSTLNFEKEKEQDEPDENLVESLTAATTISGLLEMTQVNLISEEFRYNDIERFENIDAWCKTLDYYGGLHLTPPQILVLSHMSIISSRAMSQKNVKTKEKFAYFKTFLKMKFTGLFKKKDSKDGTYSDNRKNDERQNDSGDENEQGDAT